MNPTSEAQQKIQDRVSDWTPSDQEIADALNSDLVDNPEAQDTVPKPYSMADIMGAISAQALAKVRSEGGITEIAQAVRANDDERVLMWAQSYLVTGDITQSEYDAVQAIVTDTQLDPDYDAQVPWPQVHLGRLVDADDIQKSRP